MDIKLTITVVLKDDFWGFSDLLEGRPLNSKTIPEIKDLISEDWGDEVRNQDNWIVEEVKSGLIFKTVTSDGIKEVEAEPITIAGREYFIYQDNDPITFKDVWNVSDCETGLISCLRATKKMAILAAETNFRTQPEAIEKGRELVKSLGHKLPINKTAPKPNRKPKSKRKVKSSGNGSKRVKQAKKP